MMCSEQCFCPSLVFTKAHLQKYNPSIAHVYGQEQEHNHTVECHQFSFIPSIKLKDNLKKLHSTRICIICRQSECLPNKSTGIGAHLIRQITPIQKYIVCLEPSVIPP